MDYQLNQVINLINECFIDEWSLNDFIFSHFNSIYNSVQNVSPLSTKITKFVQQVNIKREIFKLLLKLEEDYAYVFEKYKNQILFSKRSQIDYDKYKAINQLIQKLQQHFLLEELKTIYLSCRPQQANSVVTEIDEMVTELDRSFLTDSYSPLIPFIHEVNDKFSEPDLKQFLEDWLQQHGKRFGYENYENVSKTVNSSSSILEDTHPSDPSIEEVGICDILVLSANPKTTPKLQLEKEANLIKQEATNYTVRIKSDAFIEDLSRILGDYNPIILHFSGHGNSKGEIILTDREDGERSLPLKELANLLSKQESRVQCVVLNACFSGDKVDDLIPSVSCVLGMSKEIDDRAALRFAEGFYRGIGGGESYQESFELGRTQINLLQLPDSDVPHFIPRDASVIDLNPTTDRSVLQGSFPSYPLWFGTNRKPVDINNISKGFSAERDTQLHYGTCEVIVPKTHEIGSLGASWLVNFKLTDDRLKLQSDTLEVFNEAQFWSNVQTSLQQYDADERYALIFIHGFNVSFEAAALRAAQLGSDLKIPPGMMAFYSWPSKAKLKNYTADEATIEASEKYIHQFLSDWVNNSDIKKVHIIAHSMGNRGLLRVMQRIFDRVQIEGEISFGKIFLAAPDVDPDLFKDLAEAYRTLAERTTLYISSKDKALQASGIIHDYPRLGFRSSNEEIPIIEGIDTVEVSNIDLTWLAHGYYGDSLPVLQDIYDVLINGNLPDQRFALQPAIVGNQKYWVISK